MKLLALTVISFIFTFLVFPGQAYEYYLLGLFPLYLFVLATLLTKRKDFLKPLFWFLFLIFCFFAVRTVLTAKGDYGLGVKKELISEVMKVVGDKPFALTSEGKCHIAEGWRYLFSVYGRKPERSNTDKIFGWTYQNEISDKPVKYEVTIKESRVSLPFISEIKDSKVITKGGFKAYIFN